MSPRIPERIKTPVRDWLAGKVRKWVANTPMTFGDNARVSLDPTADLFDATLNVRSGMITAGAYAFCGHGVMLLTGTHDHSRIGVDRQRTVPEDGRDIVIEARAWVASGAIVLGPCRIGTDAVVAAGAVVNKDVSPGEIVGGVPARHLGWVPGYHPLASSKDLAP
jgi:acetyltransferase-like isoleucine patch superfamily enzyme